MSQSSGAVLGPSAIDVKRLSNAFCHAKLLLTAGELGVFADLEEHGPSTRDELGARVGLHPRAARDFLHGLVLLGLLELDGDRYRNSAAASATLVPGRPDYIGGFLYRANHMLYPAWGRLTEALTTGRPQTAGAADDGAFLRMLSDPAQREQYLRMMDSANSLVAPYLIERFDWPAHRRVLDVGGCRGNLGARLMLAHPHLTAGVFDLPPLAGPHAEHAERLGVAGRAWFRAGDFFADELPSSEVVILGHVLHNWSPEQRAYLIDKAYRAVTPGGALLIYDAMLPQEPADLARILVSLNMLLVTEGGSEYTAQECLGWLVAAGCTDTEVRPLGGTDTLVIGRKPI
ncbi:methyltransferase [Streptosporangium pseudovulgare]|uniref:O-methyltransferase n=1 Tax=Streptosporangium pseudovulgare TaxID=35765 RepID=A0ABQ2RB06_9ACTN|nr:methyltransferase [Streptosporangium pseudovulgare]GGQ20134.1 O-methyltransferase [Streptosporangium pseudovulgare]